MTNNSIFDSNYSSGQVAFQVHSLMSKMMFVCLTPGNRLPYSVFPVVQSFDMQVTWNHDILKLRVVCLSTLDLLTILPFSRHLCLASILDEISTHDARERKRFNDAAADVHHCQRRKSCVHPLAVDSSGCHCKGIIYYHISTRMFLR